MAQVVGPVPGVIGGRRAALRGRAGIPDMDPFSPPSYVAERAAGCRGLPRGARPADLVVSEARPPEPSPSDWRAMRGMVPRRASLRGVGASIRVGAAAG